MMNNEVIEARESVALVNNNFDEVRATIFANACEYFGIDKFEGEYKRALIFKRNGEDAICEISITKEHQGILMDFLTEEGKVRNYFFYTKSVSCIGYNETYSTTFDYYERDDSVVYDDYASCWDSMDYNDHSRESERYTLTYYLSSGECKSAYYSD